MTAWLVAWLAIAIAWADTPIDTLPQPLRLTYEEAETAWGEGDLPAAEEAFRAVTEQAPEFDRAWRRLCGVVLATGRIDDAQAACRRAVELVAGHENQTALAIALMQGDAGNEEAKELVEVVLETHRDYQPGWVALCTWASAVDDVEALDRCVPALEQSAPGTAGTLYYRSVLAAAKNDVRTAQAALMHAQSVGLTDALYEDGARRIEGATQRMAVARQRAKAKQGTTPEAQAFQPTDLLPILVLGALVLAVGVLVLGRDEDDEGDPAA